MSDNVRVYEIAEESGATSTEVISKAKKLGIELKSPQSAVSFEDAEEIANFLMTGKSSRLLAEAPKINKKPLIVQRVEKKENPNRRVIPKRSGLKIVNKKYFKETNLLEDEKNLENSNNIDKEVHEKDTKSESIQRKNFLLNSYPNVILEIKNLKTIKNITWNLQKDNGVYAIIGENGSGKSSLLICIAKLITPTIFQRELAGNGHYDKTEINYNINGQKFSWIKNSSTDNNWRQSSKDEFNMPKLKGFFESSVLTGTRFSKIDNYIKDELDYREEDKVKESSDFIVDAMNYILYGDKTSHYKFDKLYIIEAQRKRKKGNIYKDNTFSYYALKINENEYIKEYLFSTGEYFLLKLLRFIDNFEENNKSVIPALIIIDEIELSLHPLAQTRLIQQLNKWAEELNLIVIFASHSLHILDNIDPKNTFYIEKTLSNGHILTNPIGQGYLTSKLHKHTYNDKVILVEDELAKLYVEYTLKEQGFKKNYAWEVIKIGGYTQVLNVAKENATYNRMYGDADVMISLDEDVKDQFKGFHKQYVFGGHHIPVKKNIEDYILQMVISEDVDFKNFIDSLLPKGNYYSLNITTEKAKTCFNDLITELAKEKLYEYDGKTEATKVMMKERVVEFVYSQHKESLEHKKFVKELERLFKG